MRARRRQVDQRSERLSVFVRGNALGLRVRRERQARAESGVLLAQQSELRLLVLDHRDHMAHQAANVLFLWLV